MQATFEEILINRDEEDGLKVIQISTKGRGVVATKIFFLKESHLVNMLVREARQKEVSYKQDKKNIGSYMYYFFFKSKKLW